MTLQEFKAWFDGFTEGLTNPPGAKQWARIKERVKEIDGAPITERIFVDRYWHYPYAYYPWPGTPYYGLYSSGGSIGQSQVGQASFNSTAAMTMLGSSEALQAQ